MKKTLLLFLILLVAGCSGVKKTTKSDVKSDVKTNIELKKTAAENESLTSTVTTDKKTEASVKKNTSAEETESEETVIHTVVYDPTLYVDTVPNRPLKISETTQTTTKGKIKKVAESTELLYSQAEVQSLFQVYFKMSQQKTDSFNNVISSLKSEVREQTKKASNWWVWLIVGISLPVAGWIALKSGWPAKVFVWVLKIFKKI